MYLSLSLYLYLYLYLSLSFCWLGHVFSWPPSVLLGFGLVWKAGRLWIHNSQWVRTVISKVDLELLRQLKSKRFRSEKTNLTKKFLLTEAQAEVQRWQQKLQQQAGRGTAWQWCWTPLQNYPTPFNDQSISQSRKPPKQLVFRTSKRLGGRVF